MAECHKCNVPSFSIQMQELVQVMEGRGCVCRSSSPARRCRRQLSLPLLDHHHLPDSLRPMIKEHALLTGVAIWVVWWESNKDIMSDLVIPQELEPIVVSDGIFVDKSLAP